MGILWAVVALIVLGFIAGIIGWIQNIFKRKRIAAGLETEDDIIKRIAVPDSATLMTVFPSSKSVNAFTKSIKSRGIDSICSPREGMLRLHIAESIRCLAPMLLLRGKLNSFVPLTSKFL